MEYVCIGIVVLMFVGCIFICTANYYAVVAGMGMVDIAILLFIWATSCT